MIATIIIVTISILIMFALLIFHPEMKIGKASVDTFFLGPLIGAVAILAARLVDYGDLGASLVSGNGINPLQILVLFLSMSFLSILLDEAGFFSYVAAEVALKAKGSQTALFLLLYLLTSVLTVFTSNDIIILTFTPFIIFFAKNAKINPIPYLVSEFVAANTWSIILVIGNPTNIYLAESFKIGFFDYFSKMWLGAIMAGLVGLAAMYAMFRKMLKVPFAESGTKPVLKDPFLAYLSLAFLGVTIIFMAFSDFIDIPMWVVSMAGALLLIIATVLYGIKKRSGFSALGRSFARLPYSVIPFILSMFVMVLSLKDQGVIGALADALARANPYVGAGVSSYFAANFLNNIPMTVFFTEIFRTMSAPPYTMIYLAIISSNIGAFLTPVGALAGVMWTRLLKDHGIKFSFADYIRYLSPVSLLSLVAAFAGFWLLAL